MNITSWKDSYEYTVVVGKRFILVFGKERYECKVLIFITQGSLEQMFVAGGAICS